MKYITLAIAAFAILAACTKQESALHSSSIETAKVHKVKIKKACYNEKKSLYNVVIKYSNLDSTDGQYLDYYVNGSLITSITLPPTGSGIKRVQISTRESGSTGTLKAIAANNGFYIVDSVHVYGDGCQKY